MQRAWLRVALPLLFLGSGACGVGLELLWSRMLTGVFGGTTLAVVTVLTAYMGGLAWGSWWGGRFVDRWAASSKLLWRAALLYGLCEIAVGMWALCLPWGISWLPALQRIIAEDWGVWGLASGRFVLCVLLLGVPTTLMGATLPLMSRAFLRRSEDLGADVGWLYALNTAGAVLGAFVLGFFLLPWWGMWRSLLVLAGSDIMIGLFACAVAWRWRAASAQEDLEGQISSVNRDESSLTVDRDEPILASPQSEQVSVASVESSLGATAQEDDTPTLDVDIPDRRGKRWIIGGALLCSGAFGMIAQVAWTRSFAMVIGSSTYAFSLILVVFLTGLALGGAVGGWVARRWSAKGWMILGGVFFFAGVGVYSTLLWMDELPLLFFRWARQSDLSPWALLGIKAFLSGLLLWFPTFAMGMSFPLALQLWWQERPNNPKTLQTDASASKETSPEKASEEEKIGSEVGRLYAFNTMGAIIGSATAGFVWVPWVGMQGALWLVVLGYLFWAALLWSELLDDRLTGRIVGLMTWLGVGLFLYVWTPAWSAHRMSLGLFRVAHLKRVTPEALREPAPVLFYREGLHTTVTVERFGSHLGLKVNGKTDASTATDMPTQILSGALPLLLHPDAQDVAVIGWGSGVTVGAVLQFPVKRVVAVELEPAVVEGAKAFAAWNHQPQQDPRMRLRFDDGRNFLAVTRQRFDVIVSEPSNPWMSGVSALFTVEFFRLARERLRKGGILCQWIQLYELSPENIRALLHSVVRVFPHVHLFALSRNSRDTLLMASLEPLRIAKERIAQRFMDKRSGAELLRGGMRTPIDLLPRLLADDASLRWLTKGAPLNTDDNARLEMRAPFELLTHVETDGAKVLLQKLGERAHRWERLFSLPVLSPDTPGLIRADFLAELTLAWLRFGDMQRAKQSLISLQKLRDKLFLQKMEQVEKDRLLDKLEEVSHVFRWLHEPKRWAEVEACLPSLQGKLLRPPPTRCPRLFLDIPFSLRDLAALMGLSIRDPRRILVRGLLLYHKGQKKLALRELAYLMKRTKFLRRNPGTYFLLGRLYQEAQIGPEAVWFMRLFWQSVGKSLAEMTKKK